MGAAAAALGAADLWFVLEFQAVGGAWRCEAVTRGFRAGADRIAELSRQDLAIAS